MTSVNSVSGGKTSAYVAANYPADIDVFALVRLEDQNCIYKDAKLRQAVEDRIQAPFIGTAEDDTIIKTIFDLEQFIGRPITWLTGPTFEELIKQKGGYLPNRVSRYCTTELKSIPIAEYLYHKVKGPVIMRFGYRANEVNRANKMLDRTNDSGYVPIKIKVGKRGKLNRWQTVDYHRPEFPLITDNVYRDDIENYWQGKPVRFAYMNNCVGCWWRSPLLLKHMHNRDPRKMQYFADLEDGAKGTFRSDVNYKDIINWKGQHQLFDTDFNECDSGYCGL